MTHIPMPRRSNTNSFETGGSKVELGTCVAEPLDVGLAITCFIAQVCSGTRKAGSLADTDSATAVRD